MADGARGAAEGGPSVATAAIAPTGAAVDRVEIARARRARVEAIARFVLPALVLTAAVGAWQWVVVAYAIPPYVLPSPSVVFQALWRDWPTLLPSLVNTLEITFGALAIAAIGGVGLAVVFAQSKWVEMAVFPIAVVFQVTPVIAVAPLITIYVDSITAQLLICAWIVAFFPVLANTTLGLNSADHNLRSLFELYGATRWQTLVLLRLPSALPYFLGGLRIAGGLSLIGAVVAEFVVGAGGRGSGLAFRIIEASSRLNMPRMFAALILISATGVAIYLALSLVSHLMLRRWHESALSREQ